MPGRLMAGRLALTQSIEVRVLARQPCPANPDAPITHALVAQQAERVSRKDEVARSIRARGSPTHSKGASATTGSSHHVLVLQLAERPARDAGRCGFDSRRAHEGARRSGSWTVLGRFRAASRARFASLAQLDKRSSPVPRRVPVRTRQEALALIPCVRPRASDPVRQHN